MFVYTHGLKSKDIDIVVDFPELEKLRQQYTLAKNDRLKKYEIKLEETDVDVYVPNYSNPGLPAEEISKYLSNREGFTVPLPEILLILKQTAYEQRKGTPKGDKDKIDMMSLLCLPNFDFANYHEALARFGLGRYSKALKALIKNTLEMKELGLNQHQFSRLKKSFLIKL